LGLLKKGKGKAAPLEKRGVAGPPSRKAVMYSHEYVGTDAERASFLANCACDAAKSDSANDNKQFLSDRKSAAAAAGGGGAGGTKRKAQQTGIASYFGLGS
jgi:hypothetical protein